jgi:hypothetical protein
MSKEQLRRVEKLEGALAGAKADPALAALWDGDSANRLYDVLLPKGKKMTAEERREVATLEAARRAWRIIHFGEDENDYDPSKPSAVEISVAKIEAKLQARKQRPVVEFTLSEAGPAGRQ